MRINEENVRRAIDRGLSQLSMTEERKRVILAQCRPSVALAPTRARRALRRVAAVAAAFAVMVAAAAGAMAASPGLAERLDMLSRQALAFLYPVEQAAEADGIRMEVLAAMNDEDVAVVYMSLQDTAGSGRVSDSVTLSDVEISGASFTSSEVVQLDPATDTAILRLTGSCGELSAQRVSVTLRGFLSGETCTPLAGPGWTLDEVTGMMPESPLEYPGEFSGWMATGEDHGALSSQLESGSMPVLKPQGEPVALTDWCELVAADEVDGALHLQTRPDTDMGRFDRLDFVLTDATGERLRLPYAQVDLGEQTRTGIYTHSERQETILPLPPETDREDLRVNYDLLTYEQYVEGCWSVSFQMEDAPAQRSAACAIEMGGWTVEEVSVTPLGVTVRGQGEMFPSSSLDASPEVVLRDGSTAAFNASSTSTDGENNIEMKSLFVVPIPPQDVAYVRIAGQTIELGE